MTKLKWGIIGCGVIAPWHADSVVASDYADLVAVCDIDVEKGKAFAEKYSTAFFADYKQMLTEANTTARNPNTLDRLKSAGPAAIRAPTTMTEEIALVTLMSGECSAGVTLQTT